MSVTHNQLMALFFHVVNRIFSTTGSQLPLPYPRSPHFPCGENADGSIRTGTRRNLRILIWKKNAEKMRMGVFGQEYGEISTLYPHFTHNAENISAFTILRILAIMRRITWRIMRRRTDGQGETSIPTFNFIERRV